MKVFKVTPGEGLAPCCEKEIKNVSVWIEEAERGEVITVEVLEMSEKEYEELPEYIGP